MPDDSVPEAPEDELPLPGGPDKAVTDVTESGLMIIIIGFPSLFSTRTRKDCGRACTFLKPICSGSLLTFSRVIGCVARCCCDVEPDDALSAGLVPLMAAGAGNARQKSRGGGGAQQEFHECLFIVQLAGLAHGPMKRVRASSSWICSLGVQRDVLTPHPTGRAH
jgi:hypothetical protein